MVFIEVASASLQTLSPSKQKSLVPIFHRDLRITGLNLHSEICLLTMRRTTCRQSIAKTYHANTQVWQQHGTAEETLRGIAGLEVPLHTAGYDVECDLWDVFSSRRAGSLCVHVQPTGAFWTQRALEHHATDDLMVCAPEHAVTDIRVKQR